MDIKKADEKQDELGKLKSQIKELKILHLTFTVTFLIIVAGFQMQYSTIRSYYQSSIDLNRDIAQHLQSVNRDVEEWNQYLEEHEEYLKDILSELDNKNQ